MTRRRMFAWWEYLLGAVLAIAWLALCGWLWVVFIRWGANT